MKPKLSLTAKILIGIFFFWALIGLAAAKDFWVGVFLGAFFVFFAAIFAIIIRAVRKKPIKKLSGILPVSLIAFIASSLLSTAPPKVDSEPSREIPAISEVSTAETTFITSTEALSKITTTTETQTETTTEQLTATQTTTLHETTTQKAVETTSKIITETSTEHVTIAPVQTSNNTASTERIVYIGDSGTKYHKANCKTLKGNAYAITYAEAIAQGRTPCKVCGG